MIAENLNKVFFLDKTRNLFYYLSTNLYASLSFCGCPELASTEKKTPQGTLVESWGHGGETGLRLMLSQSIA